MRVAIIGGGISGMVAAYLLHPQHDVTVYEAGNYIGGHTNTIDVETPNGPLAIDTGFIVFNDRTYPNFIALLNKLKVPSQTTTMSFSVKCERTGLEYRGADFDGLFAQRRNLFRPSFYRLLLEIVRFNKLGHQLLANNEQSDLQSVGSFLSQHSFSESFIEQYFLPMGSAIWSASFELFSQFPIRFICEFYKNHGLLGISDRPQWRVIQHGSKSYIGPLTNGYRDRIRLGTKVIRVKRKTTALSGGAGAVDLRTESGDSATFDHVVFSCHSDQALAILGDDASATETEVLSAFPYQRNVALLHTQSDVLPKTRRSWACWNYFNPKQNSGAATVTYNMNMLQSLKTDKTYCVTLNDHDRIKDENVIQSFVYHHPTFGINRSEMQQRHHELIDVNNTSFCGAYWGNGFHEDGVNSAIAVANIVNGTKTIC